MGRRLRRGALVATVLALVAGCAIGSGSDEPSSPEVQPPVQAASSPAPASTAPTATPDALSSSPVPAPMTPQPVQSPTTTQRSSNRNQQALASASAAAPLGPAPPPDMFVPPDQLPDGLDLVVRDQTLDTVVLADRWADEQDHQLHRLGDLVAPGRCIDEAAQRSSVALVDGVEWSTYTIEDEEAAFAAVGTQRIYGHPTALLVQAVGSTPDPAGVITQLRDLLERCPVVHEPYGSGELPTAWDPPAIGQDAVAWRVPTTVHPMFLFIEQAVVWHDGDHVGAVIAISPADLAAVFLPATEAPTDLPSDQSAERDLRTAVVETARLLDEGL